MRKVFVTVGTTPFDGLVAALDKKSSHDVVFQIGPGQYIPQLYSSFRYTQDIDGFYTRDLIVCHAGAGTVYPLLEANKRIIVVPNLERQDDHQRELSDFLRDQSYCYCVDLSDIQAMDFDELILRGLHFPRRPYMKDSFFAVKDIVKYFAEDS